MVTKSKTGEKKSRVKVGKLKLNKETVKDLGDSEQNQIKGGIRGAGGCGTYEHTVPLSYTCVPDCNTRNLRCV